MVLMNVSVPILMYHEVTPQPLDVYRKYSVTPAELARQLAWLRTEGYSAVDMDEIHAAMSGERALPERPVAITFDDGSRDCIEHGVPVLLAQGFTATFFIVAGMVGATTRWLLAERGFELPTADWPTLRQAEDAGMRCEAHSVSHPRLSMLSARECRAELAHGREVLAEGLGHDVRHLAYPFGAFTAETRDIAADAGYVTACTTHEAIATHVDDLLALPRVPVLGTEGITEFVHRVRTARPVGALRERAERIARRLGLPGPRRSSA
jgi:peptidoglycan/xylan/chitin deacetylase (PgdA/CDA1 family)